MFTPSPEAEADPPKGCGHAGNGTPALLAAPHIHRPEPQFNPGLPPTIPLDIPRYWSAETALAVFALVDEIRAIILAVYTNDIQEAARQQCQPLHAEKAVIPNGKLPF